MAGHQGFPDCHYPRDAGLGLQPVQALIRISGLKRTSGTKLTLRMARENEGAEAGRIFDIASRAETGEGQAI